MSASPAPGTPGSSHWKEYKSADGRVYWSHAQTKQSVWEKPDELKTPFERAMNKTPWKQFTSKGKPYYVNSVTKETLWDLPPELVDLKNKVEEQERRRARGDTSPEPDARSRSPSPARSDASDDAGAMQRYRSRSPEEEEEDNEPLVIPHGGFKNHAEAEAGFMRLLKRIGVDESWTWEQTLRRIVVEPMNKALETLAEKKAAFEKFLDNQAKERAAAKEARMAEVRPHLRKAFKTAGIKSYHTVKTGDQLFRSNKHWRRALPDERAFLLDEYTSELRQKEASDSKDLREYTISKLTDLIPSLDISVTTKWRAAHDVIVRSSAFKEDAKLGKMETIDILNVFDTHMSTLEKEHKEESARLAKEYKRRARKARDAYKELLRELREQGKLHRRAKWKDVFPTIKADERYEALLGLPGSSALDLWMDAVDDLQVEAEERAGRIESEIPKGKVTLETTLEDFEGLCKEAGVEASEERRKEAFDVIHERLARAKADEDRRAERKRRHRIEDLRDALRRIRSITPDTTYEDATMDMEKIPEFKLLSDEDRRSAFDKHIRRLREKASERRDRMDVDRTDRDWRAARDERYSRDSHSREPRDSRDGRDSRERRDRDRGLDYRDSRDRDRDRERERERDRDRDRDRKRDERDPKRRRVSTVDDGEREEGEI